MSSHRRGPWSNQEDGYLMQLVKTHGPLNWVRIAQTLGTRTPKQCRERYHQNLKPSLNHHPITAEEGAQIEQMVLTMGKRWAEIARRLHGRSDNAVKNWWNGSQNRRRRMDRRRAGQPLDASYDRPPLSISTSSLPLPRAQSSPQLSYAYPHSMPWVEPPLPSPCSSESAESDAGSNYATSPGRRCLPLHNNIELPPLRSAQAYAYNPSQLPGFSSFARPVYNDASDCQPRLPGIAFQGQLPTAPSSPVQQLQQQQQQQHPQQSRAYEEQQAQYQRQYNAPRQVAEHQQQQTSPELPKAFSGKDGRMNLSALLE